MQSGEHRVALTTNTPEVAEQVVAIMKGRAAEGCGGRCPEQWKHSADWILDVLTATTSSQAQCWVDFTGVPLGRARGRRGSEVGYPLLPADGGVPQGAQARNTRRKDSKYSD